MSIHLKYSSAAIERLCRERKIRRLDLFGSWANGKASTDSDIDLLVDYDPVGGMTMFKFLELEDELGKLFGGRKVDLVSVNGLSPYLRDEILRTRRPLYEG
ncbi:MAG: nucleotidyltransferase domain-containing protein [bacterium]